MNWNHPKILKLYIASDAVTLGLSGHLEAIIDLIFLIPMNQS